MDWLLAHFESELFHFGDTSVTPLALIIFAVTIVVTLVAARFARTIIGRVLRRNRQVNEGIAYAIGRIAQYTIIVVGVLLGLENIGISVTAFAALGAILSVGIGFGLQNIAQNFISGLILLIERPIQQGDVLEIAGGTVGRVTEIGMRATVILTTDGVSILVPNSTLISEQVRNFHAPAPVNRLRIGVGVAYGTDTALVRDTLLAVAAADERVKDTPKPDVFFQNFGDSSLDFELAVWNDNAEIRTKLASDLRFAIDAAFREKHIAIPFPQRDLHLISGFPSKETQAEELPERRA